MGTVTQPTTPAAGGRPDATVRRLPPAFHALEEEPLAQPGAGGPGKVGVLRMRFERTGTRTRLAGLYAAGPQRVQRVLYLDEALPGTAVVLVQSVGGGILQGDRLAVEIELGPGAHALVTTQSATKVYRMERNYATQRLTARVAPGAHLELLTDYLIPYAGARLYSEVDLDVAAGATAVYADGIAPGRTAAGESFAYRLLHTRLRARDLDGALRLADTTVLAPRAVSPARPGLLGGWTDLGSLAVLCPPEAAATLGADVAAGLAGAGGVLGGASALPGGDGVMVRVLGRSQRLVQAALHHAWRRSRAVLHGAGVPPVATLKHGREPPDPGGTGGGTT